MTFIFHLMGASGSIRRTVRAADIREARAKLAPIPEDWSVISDASYRLGTTFRPIGPAMCVGCGQRYRTAPHDYCEKCVRVRTAPKLARAESQAKWRAKLPPERKRAIARRNAVRKREAYWERKAEQSELGL